MSGQLDRPPRRPRGPRPAPDAAVDPIDYRPAPSQEAETPASVLARENELPASELMSLTPGARSRAVTASLPPEITGTKRDITVQVNQRMSLEVANVFDEAARRFPTKRAAIEYAVMTAFGPQNGSPSQ